MQAIYHALHALLNHVMTAGWGFQILQHPQGGVKDSVHIGMLASATYIKCTLTKAVTAVPLAVVVIGFNGRATAWQHTNCDMLAAALKPLKVYNTRYAHTSKQAATG